MVGRSLPTPRNLPWQMGPRGVLEQPNYSPPYGGFAIMSDQPGSTIKMGQSVQLFSVPDPTAEEELQQKFVVCAPLTSADMGLNGAQWWIVSIQGIQLTQFGNGPFFPIDAQDILVRGQRWTNYQARIDWNDGTARQRSIDIDIGGGATFQVFARNVNASVVGPANTVLVQPGEAPPISDGVTEIVVWQAIISARIHPNEFGVYDICPPNLTRTINNPGGGPFFVDLPSGSRRVQLFQTGGTPIPFYEFVGDIGSAPFLVCAEVTNPTGTSFSFPEVRIPACGRRIRIPADPGPAARRFAIVFEICP